MLSLAQQRIAEEDRLIEQDRELVAARVELDRVIEDVDGVPGYHYYAVGLKRARTLIFGETD